MLDGLRVLDLTIWRPGPYATQLLAELGADVLKVEPPGGDPMRAYPALFASLHANKRSVVLDLKREGDRERALELAADADAIIEGFRPGVAERLGMGYDAVVSLNPSVVYCSVSGMGQTGPLAHAPGHDVNYQALSGVLSPDGGAPVIPGVPVADLAGGLAAAFAVCAAALRRMRTGEGERIDVAMADVLATWTGAARPEAMGVADPTARGVPGYGTFETADAQYIALGVLTEDHFWASLCDGLGLTDERGLRFVERMDRRAELQERIVAAIRARPRDMVMRELAALDVPVSPVLDRSGMLDLPHFRHRGVVTGDPWADPAVGFPVRFEHHPARRTAPPPRLDEHAGAGFLVPNDEGSAY